jgi:ribosomal protein S18 acetylase RimI-like enzyme
MASSIDNQTEHVVRPVRREDSKRIWEIRNHPDVRVYTNNPEDFDFVSHDQWFEKKYFTGELNFCFVLETVGDANVIGYCRYDREPEQSHHVISIALDPNHHGHGLGHLLLSESLQQFSNRGRVWAEIKHTNIRSMKLFEKNHFVRVGEDEENYHFIYQPE